MSTEYSKTLLRKGALKTHGGNAIPRHALQRKTGTSDEEEAALLDAPRRDAGSMPPNRARLRGE
jgi:hypothetical protein